MSTSVTVYGYFGLPVRQEHFLVPIDTIRECSMTPQHTIEPKSKFCGECGGKVIEIEVMTPSKGFSALCEHLNFRATTKFHHLLADSYIKPWSEGWNTGDTRFGLYEANALVFNGTDKMHYVLGYKIGEFSSSRWYNDKAQTPTISINEAEMAAFSSVLVPIANALRVSDGPRMFCSARWG